jgi:hypothetical protein
MDKVGVRSSLLACSQVDDMTVGSGMVVKDEMTQTQAACGNLHFRPFFSSLGSTSSSPELSGCFMVVTTELSGGEAHERVDDTEP